MLIKIDQQLAISRFFMIIPLGVGESQLVLSLISGSDREKL
jgi:hypothetical protein